MSPTLTCLALALVGVDLGYQPLSNGGSEFIIQISPATLQALQPGVPIEMDVPREAQDLRPTHFRISLGSESLPHVAPPVSASNPPARAPTVQANPVMRAMATTPATSPDAAAAGEPLMVPPPGSAASAANRGLQAPIQDYHGASAAAATSGDAKFQPLARTNAEPNGPPQPEHAWLAMCLFVIALAASNGYLGWLFWDARQRYLELVKRTFAIAPQTAEA